MGYRAEKLKIEKQIKILKRVALCVLFLIIASLCIFSAFVPPESWKYYVAKPKVGKRRAGELRLHFIDVGQGDATVIEFPDGKTMLIDGGDGSGSAEKSLMRYLNALKIKKLDYLVLTHADGDHCGGLDTVLKYKEVSAVYLPTSDPNTSQAYAEFYTQLAEEDCRRFYVNKSVALDNEKGKYPYKVRFLHPYTSETEKKTETEKTEADENANSAVIWIEYNGFQALFMGDAPQEVETSILYDADNYFEKQGVSLSDVELLKVSHHGSEYATGAEFLSHLHLEKAVISCGKGNEYGHPNDSVLNRLQTASVEVWRTDLQGHILATVHSGEDYKVKNIR